MISEKDVRNGFLMSLMNNQNLEKKIKAKSVDLSSYDAIYFVKTTIFGRKFH